MPTAKPKQPIGISWTSKSLAFPASGVWRHFAYSNGIFVAVQESTGTSTAAYSTDGRTWSSSSMGVGGLWRDISADSSGTFVVVGDNGQSVVTQDGLNWTSVTLPEVASYRGVVAGNGIFVATAQGFSTVSTSTDGFTWTSGGNFPSVNSWAKIAFDGTNYVAVASSSTSAAISTDAITWSTRTLPSGQGVSNQLTYCGGVFILCSTATVFAVSTDGTTWTNRTTPGFSLGKNRVVYTDGMYISCVSTAVNYVLASTDTITWRSVPVSFTNQITGLVYSDDKQILVSGFFTGRDSGVSSPYYSPSSVVTHAMTRSSNW